MKLIQFIRAMSLVALSVIATIAVTAVPAQAQATRTWVSGVGDDVNPCSRTAPCKTFAGAVSKTTAGGEIDCLDPGGFGAVTITKSLTIDCGETQGSILASGTNGENINDSSSAFPNTIRVVLRGLTINGAGNGPQNAQGNPGTGLVGVNFTSGGSLYMEDVYIQNFNAGTAVGIRIAPAGTARASLNNVTVVNCGTGASGGGIRIQPTGAAGNARVSLANVRLIGNAGDAVRLDSTGNTNGSSITLNVVDSVIERNTNGVTVVTAVGTAPASADVFRSMIDRNAGNALTVSGTPNSLIRAGGNTITVNVTPTAISGGGLIQSYGDNYAQGNSFPATFSGAPLGTN